jgi:hypothetical protein
MISVDPPSAGGITLVIDSGPPSSAELVEAYRSDLYKKCSILSRLTFVAETELKKLADMIVADYSTSVSVEESGFSVGYRALPSLPACEEIGRTPIVREVARRRDALSSIFVGPSLHGIGVNHHGTVFSEVQGLLTSACDPLIIDGEFSAELAADSSTDVYMVKMKEVICRPWAPKKTLADCFDEMLDIWLKAKKSEPSWLWRLVGDGVAVDVLIKYGRSTWNPHAGGGPVLAWSEGNIVTY